MRVCRLRRRLLYHALWLWSVSGLIVLHAKSHETKAFPDIQAKVYAAVDAVVGRDRMPNMDDLSSLPYVRAFVLEALRWRSVARFVNHFCQYVK